MGDDDDEEDRRKVKGWKIKQLSLMQPEEMDYTRCSQAILVTNFFFKIHTLEDHLQ